MNIDELRRALDAETRTLTVEIPVARIQRRVRGLRVRRSAAVGVAGVLALAAVATPLLLLRGGTAASPDVGGPVPPAPPTGCVTDHPYGVETLGPLFETGSVLSAPALGTRYDVLVGLSGTREAPGYVVAFRNQATGAVEPWNTVGLARTPGGDVPGKQAGDPSHRFVSSQLTLGPNRVLDLGFYTRAAARITVASEGREVDAQTALNGPTGWTFFWVERLAAPLRPAYGLTSQTYDGPEVPTLTAYDTAGRPQDRVGGGNPLVGLPVQNPRDHGVAEQEEVATPSASAPGPPTGCAGSGQPT